MGAQLSLRSIMKGNVLVLTVSRVLWSMSDSLAWPYLSLYILFLGGTAEIVGFVYAIGTMAACVLYPIGGYIADKAGRARLVSMATLLYITSFAVFAFANSWEWLAFAYAYQQVVLFYMPALNAIMADSIPVGARGRIYAVTVSIPNAVRVITPYLGGYLIAVYTLQPAMRLSYTLSFCIGLVVAFIRLRYLKETITNGERIGRKVPKILIEGYKNVFTSLKWVISNMPGYIGMAVLLSFIGSLVIPFWIVYAQNIIGISAYMWGVILLIGGLVNTLSSLVVGNLIDRIGIRKCMIMAFLLSIPPMFLFTLARDFYQVAAIWIVLMIASSFLWISSSVYLADVIPRGMRGRVMAGVGQGVSFGITGVGYSSGFLLFIPMTIGSVISGYIYNYNSVYPWYIQSVFLTVGLIICLFFIKNPEKPEA